MITCPECGQEAPDDAKFCDRCGRGLSKAATSASQSPTRPTPLTAGTSLKGGIEIVGLTGQTSIENRYRAKRIRDGKTESIALRERLGPQPTAEVVDEAPLAATPEPPSPRPEDPNGPSAKTAELRPAVAQTNGTASPPQLHASSSQAGESASANASGEGVQSAVDFNADPGPASTVMAGAATNSSADEATEAAIAAIATEAQPNRETDDGAHADAAAPGGEDLGEVFGRVLALSQTINHPAFQRATEGFAEN